MGNSNSIIQHFWPNASFPAVTASNKCLFSQHGPQLQPTGTLSFWSQGQICMALCRGRQQGRNKRFPFFAPSVEGGKKGSYEPLGRIPAKINAKKPFREWLQTLEPGETCAEFIFEPNRHSAGDEQEGIGAARNACVHANFLVFFSSLEPAAACAAKGYCSKPGVQFQASHLFFHKNENMFCPSFS